MALSANSCRTPVPSKSCKPARSVQHGLTSRRRFICARAHTCTVLWTKTVTSPRWIRFHRDHVCRTGNDRVDRSTQEVEPTAEQRSSGGDEPSVPDAGPSRPPPTSPGLLGWFLGLDDQQKIFAVVSGAVGLLVLVKVLTFALIVLERSLVASMLALEEVIASLLFRGLIAVGALGVVGLFVLVAYVLVVDKKPRP